MNRLTALRELPTLCCDGAWSLAAARELPRTLGLCRRRVNPSAPRGYSRGARRAPRHGEREGAEISPVQRRTLARCVYCVFEVRRWPHVGSRDCEVYCDRVVVVFVSFVVRCRCVLCMSTCCTWTVYVPSLFATCSSLLINIKIFGIQAPRPQASSAQARATCKRLFSFSPYP